MISGFTSLTLYKVNYAPDTLRMIDLWAYVYTLGEISKKGSNICADSMQNIFSYPSSKQLNEVCEAIVNNISELYKHYFGTKEEKNINGIKVTINTLKDKFSSSSKKTKDDVDKELEKYENEKRAEIDSKIREYRASEEQKIKDSLERTEKINKAAAKTRVEEFEKTEKARIAKELADKAEADRKAIEEVKQQVISALRKNAYDAKRKKEEDEYNKKVETMPEERQKFNKDMSEQLRVLSSDFRNSTVKVSDNMTNIVSEMVGKLNTEVNDVKRSLDNEVKSVKDSLDKKISAVIAELNASTSGIMTSLSTSTETAVNSTVNIERALKNDDFNDLLEAYCRLDSQTYYRRQKGTDSEEYKGYWKGVEAYLRGFKNTLSKFGYEVYSPSVGYSPESVDDFNFDDRECEDYPETNEECKDFIITAIVNSGIRHKENNGEYYIDQKPRIVVKRKDENNGNGDGNL
ncbi:MAG: hypothetical protein NC340_00420 [Ruminococcus flavefaciens]|nr:hypothetical protein [Ruminococcus flavefaciens]